MNNKIIAIILLSFFKIAGAEEFKIPDLPSIEELQKELQASVSPPSIKKTLPPKLPPEMSKKIQTQPNKTVKVETKPADINIKQSTIDLPQKTVVNPNEFNINNNRPVPSMNRSTTNQPPVEINKITPVTPMPAAPIITNPVPANNLNRVPTLPNEFKELNNLPVVEQNSVIDKKENQQKEHINQPEKDKKNKRLNSKQIKSNKNAIFDIDYTEKHKVKMPIIPQDAENKHIPRPITMRTYSEACFDAIVRDDIDDLSTFIKLGEINKFFDDQRNNLLIFAASVKNYNAVKWLLLNTDININHRNIYKATALHAAVLNHDVRTVRLLLAHDARVDLRDRNGMKARHYTIEMGYDDLAHLIPKK